MKEISVLFLSSEISLFHHLSLFFSGGIDRGHETSKESLQTLMTKSTASSIFNDESGSPREKVYIYIILLKDLLAINRYYFFPFLFQHFIFGISASSACVLRKVLFPM